MKSTDTQVLVVGAGLAGLTSSVYLSRKGYAPLLLEKTDRCGGLCNSFSKNGYTFDSGARALENSGIIFPMLEELKIELELVRSYVSIGIDNKVVHLESQHSIDEYQNMLCELYPSDQKEIAHIFTVIKEIMKDMEVVYGFDNPVFKNFRTDKHYIFHTLLPWMGKFLKAIHRIEKRGEPVESYLARITSNQSLIDLIAQHFFKKTPTSFALGYFHVYLDYYYPKGGTGSFTSALQQLITSQGGTIQTSTEIVSINPTKHEARDNNGNIYKYKKLVWCGDIKKLYRLLDTSSLDSRTKKLISSTSAAVEASRGGDSVFTMYVGVHTEPHAFSSISRGHMFYTPSTKGLGEVHLSEVHALIHNPSTTEEEIALWVKTYLNLTTYEISIPSLRDNSLSPEGKTGLIISFLFPYDLVDRVYHKGWYDKFKSLVEGCAVDVLRTTIFSGLLDSIDCIFSSSPRSIEQRFGNSEGAITGWTFEQESPAIHKLKKIGKSIQTPIPDVLQAGQWAYSPAGIPTAILTGWYASDYLIREWEKEK